MNASILAIIKNYIRELENHRLIYFFSFMVIAVVTLFLAATWPKSYTSSATIYADNSNILQPLMEGNAVTTQIVDQARMAREILFKRQFNNEILEAAGYEPLGMTQNQKDQVILDVQENVVVENVGGSRNVASLIRISYSHRNPVLAFSIVQKYTTLFIEESVIEKRQESRGAFEFIQNQVTSYHDKLLESEERLSDYKSANNNGTLADANRRISGYRAEIERLQLDIVQLETEEQSVLSELAGESVVSRDLSEINALMMRINTLQVQLDDLLSRYHDNYPDVVRVRNQINELLRKLEDGGGEGYFLTPDIENQGMTPLHQELRSRLAAIKTSIKSKTTQLEGIENLLAKELDRIKLINTYEAELAELTRDYNVTRDFYNEMLLKLENARVSMHLDEEEQGLTFKVQESADIPTQPDGLSFTQLIIGSLLVSLASPIGLLVLYMELDPRITREENFSEEFPPLLVTVPTMKSKDKKRISNLAFGIFACFLTVLIYGGVGTMHLMELV